MKILIEIIKPKDYKKSLKVVIIILKLKFGIIIPRNFRNLSSIIVVEDYNKLYCSVYYFSPLGSYKFEGMTYSDSKNWKINFPCKYI